MKIKNDNKYSPIMTLFIGLAFLLSSFLSITSAGGGLELPPLDTTRSSSSTVGRVEGEVNVLLALQTNQEAGHVNNLLSNTDLLY